ncbi:unnamed protein product [Phaedon cochleariae]|uniref:Protein takeout n=1 Tax=Phaedon cochleariae TaxID=80249 RepID=A0A9P0DSV8_PHACE|nr:unnamed protein product [Phaedon cochleariae]
MPCLFLIVFVSCYSLSEAKIFSQSYIIPCHKDDPNLNACAMKHAKLAIPHLLDAGDRKYGIPKLKPLELDMINLESGGNMKLSLSNVKMFGLDSVNLEKVRIDLPNKAFHFDFKAGNIDILGHYDLIGNILSFPLNGNGECNMTAGNVDIRFNLTYDLIEKNSETYMDLNDNNIDIETNEFHFQFDNLFNGNEELGRNINRILNEEWKTLYTEFKPAVTKTISTVAGTIIKRMFGRVPYHMIFI